MASSGKKTRGKQMIDMKIIEKEDEKLITLSKRRSGIYEKLSEITLHLLLTCRMQPSPSWRVGSPNGEWSHCCCETRW
ncbi:hypothetical protein V6N13_027547 [Hibiscus sabdariffa]